MSFASNLSNTDLKTDDPLFWEKVMNMKADENRYELQWEKVMNMKADENRYALQWEKVMKCHIH